MQLAPESPRCRFVHANRFVHAGEWQKRGTSLATKLAGKSAGILGLGRIGKDGISDAESTGIATRGRMASARGTSSDGYGNSWIMRCQLKGPNKVALSRPTLSPGLTLSFSHSILGVLPCTTMRWKFFTL
jgi:hypothetical protein